MSFADKYAKHRCERDTEFKALWEAEERICKHELTCENIRLRLELKALQADRITLNERITWAMFLGAVTAFGFGMIAGICLI